MAELTEITTASGFRCSVEEDALNDMELLENLIALDKGDAAALPDLLLQLLGASGKKALYDHVRTAHGRVPAGAVMTELGEILEALKTRKK